MSQEMNSNCAICLSLNDICVTCKEREAPVPPTGGEVETVERARKIESLRGAFEQRFKLDIWPIIDWLRNSGLDDRAHVNRLQAEVLALQQRLTIADQRVDDLSWIAKSGYMEGWEMGWVERHTDHNNEKRVMPWAPPRQVMDREWLTSEVRAALNPTAPAATVVSFVCVVDETCGGDAAVNGESQ